MAKIGVLEDDSLMRLALKESLRALGHEVVFDSGSASEFVSQARSRHIELALLDVHLGSGITGIDVGFTLRGIYPNMGLVFLTSFADPRLISSANMSLPQGSIYIEKSKIESIGSIDSAIASALKGGGQGTYGSSSDIGLLTNKQVEVLRLVASGLSNSQIAQEQSSTVKNIEAVISRIIKTLGLRDIETQNQRVHMARAYFRYRGVKLDD
ncbi:MAG TPA: response regulator transcription factor [Aquiluna sp.]